MYLLYVVFVFVSASGGGALKDSGAVCFSQRWRKPAGISRLLLPSASYYFSKQVQSAHPGGLVAINLLTAVVFS